MGSLGKDILYYIYKWYGYREMSNNFYGKELHSPTITSNIFTNKTGLLNESSVNLKHILSGPIVILV